MALRIRSLVNFIRPLSRSSVIRAIPRHSAGRHLSFPTFQRSLVRSYCSRTTPESPVTSVSNVDGQSVSDQSDYEDIEMAQLYATHIPTTAFQKMLLSVGSAAMAIANPARGDMVATLGETTGMIALPYMRRRMESDPDGHQILMERPRLTNTTVDFATLRRLPDGTLGREYMRFLEKLDTTPDARPPVQFVDDVDLAYVMQRYRETHDLYHTVLEMPTTMLGEVVVKWYEGVQFGLPMAISGGIFGALRLFPKQRQKYVQTHLQWAVTNARKSAFLLNVYWEKHWHEQLQDLRRQLNIDEPPK